MNPILQSGIPPGNLFKVLEAGLFATKFTDYVKPTTENMMLFSLVGHTTLNNCKTIKLAPVNGVLFLQLPSHMTH
jgi:hypothetical protein